ncbi:hypothetical protein XPR_0680 [Xanthomonas arboricola pv. pruni MAFF 301420]|uniref:Uncharacterized protein n=2 Tax=Xanthomonas arboricola pv. pruni TaxID=69929 RepID=W4SBS8_9XANT|nr:hypothetical protein XPU_1730 [Xanthomonas arboricola pv. pruni str. MAFF 311562]GAE54045.1 hypothetical protein XPR_0680 [Xanthomonas arboricola pv. pruni MAFF 301420]GAE61916.1 hypothetical protein XPN_3822 [Xanthomonas arboricola pv. pruni MAFF 301427]
MTVCPAGSNLDAAAGSVAAAAHGATAAIVSVSAKRQHRVVIAVPSSAWDASIRGYPGRPVSGALREIMSA